MKSSGIGGQAVLEGVMMKNRDKYAVAIRTSKGEITVDTKPCKSMAEKNVIFRLPILRGVVAFIESLYIGVKTLTYSSEFLEEEEEENQSQNEAVFTILTVLLSVILAVGLFMILPLFLSELFRRQVHNTTLLAVIEGVIRILLFIGYVLVISQMKDIRRVFMYHGAEHKTINCVESGKKLTVENVRGQSKHHKRCGTSFMLFVMIISVLFFIIIHVENIWLRMVYRLLLVPVIAGVSYEFIRLAGSTDNKVVAFLSKPGMWLQALTTKEPDDDMIEVAIASVEAVFDWKTYQEQCRRDEKRKKNKQNKNSGKKGLPKEQDGTAKKSDTKKKSKAERAADIARREAERAERRKKEEEEIRMLEEAEAKLQERLLEAKKRREERLAKEKLEKEKEETAKAAYVDEEHDEILDKLDRYFEYEEEEDGEEENLETAASNENTEESSDAKDGNDAEDAGDIEDNSGKEE